MGCRGSFNYRRTESDVVLVGLGRFEIAVFLMMNDMRVVLAYCPVARAGKQEQGCMHATQPVQVSKISLSFIRCVQ